MWDQLTMVKESKGQLGVLATRRALYRATAEEGFEMVTHISKLRQLQEELHIMGSLISDEDFVMILVFESPVFCGFLAIFGTVEAGAIKKKLCHESRCLKQVIFPVWTGLNWKNYLF